PRCGEAGRDGGPGHRRRVEANGRGGAESGTPRARRRTRRSSGSRHSRDRSSAEASRRSVPRDAVAPRRRVQRRRGMKMLSDDSERPAGAVERSERQGRRARARARTAPRTGTGSVAKRLIGFVMSLSRPMRRALLTLFVGVTVSASLSAQADPFASLRFLLGDWTAIDTPAGETGAFTFRTAVQDRVIVRTNDANYAATAHPPASRHDDNLIAYRQ